MAQTVVGSTTISASTMPAHTHTSWQAAWSNAPVGSGCQYTGDPSGDIAGSSVGSGGSHNHTITMAIQYIDMIIASKN